MWVHNCIVYTVVTYSSIHLILYILVDEILISLYSLYIISSSYRLANIQCKCIHCVFHVYYSLFLILKGKFTDSQPTLYRYNIGISNRTMCIIFTCHLHQEIRQTSVGWHKTCHFWQLQDFCIKTTDRTTSAFLYPAPGSSDRAQCIMGAVVFLPLFFAMARFCVSTA